MATLPVPNMDEATILAGKLPVKRTATHIYFFGYEGPDPEVCFQQWYPSPFKEDNLEGSPSFPTSEHYMMYRKALIFGDEVVAKKILDSKTPGLAKNLGRQAGPFNQSKWDSTCDEIVERGNYLKFSQNPKLKEILLNTGSKLIVEASPSDRIWGIGFDAEHAEGNEAEWGVNKLGKALMRVRQRLRGGEVLAVRREVLREISTTILFRGPRCYNHVYSFHELLAPKRMKLALILKDTGFAHKSKGIQIASRQIIFQYVHGGGSSSYSSKRMPEWYLI